MEGRTEAAGRDRGVDFFVSYASSDRTWAEWIAWEIEDAGYTVVLQAWDFRPGSDFVVSMRGATSGAERTLAVLSPAYLRSEHGIAEWAAAYAADPSGGQGKLLPIRVAEFDADGLDRTRVWVDLVGLDEEQARQRLRAGLSTERAKPKDQPAFPRTRSATSAPRFPPSLPPVWNLPHHPNPNFTGREDLLAALEEVGAPGKPTVLSQAITGLGGVGKTQLAAEYAYRHRADFDVVWWVRAEEPVTLVQDLAALAPAVGLDPGPELDAAVASVRAWLEGNDRWLVIFDNATDPTALQAVLPRGGGGRVLVTSRNPSWGALARVLPVDVLAQQEAVAFLMGRSGDAEQAAADELATELGCLPLAIEQAGAFVAESPGMTLRRYLELFRSRAGELLARGRHDYEATVATTWELAFQAVERASPAAAALLRVCAFVNPDDIPLGMIITDDWAQPLDALADDPLALADALGTLGRFSLVTSAAGEMVAVHRLVQLVVRQRMTEAERRSWAGRVATAIATAFPRDSHDVRGWERCALLLPHALAATSFPGVADGDAAGPASQLLDRAATYLQGRARFGEARHLFERALVIAEAAYGREHTAVGARLNNLALVVKALGDPAAARPLLERALAIAEAAYGPEHPEVGRDLNNLATVLQVLGDPAAARPLLERALAIAEAAYGPEHPEVGTDLNNLAMVLRDLGDPAAARLLFERALAIAEAAYGPEHPVVGTHLNNLATVLQDLGDPAAARLLFERALAIDEAAYGPDHPVVGTDLNNLATVLRDLGDPTAARPLLKRALAIAEAAYGPDHPVVGTRLNNLATVLQDLGDPAAARRLLERALAIAEAAYGPDHPVVGTRLNNLATVLQDLGDPAAARPLLERALAIAEAAYGPEHPRTELFRRHLPTN